MTDFFTRCCKSVSLLGLCAILCWSGLAQAEGIQVKQAELVKVDTGYALNADFAVQFTAELEKAVNKGVRLDFLVEFQLVTPREYWFDKEIVTRTRRITLQYHALSRQYLLSVDKQQKAFTTIDEVRQDLGQLRGWKVLEPTHVLPGEQYDALLRFRLDPAGLPKALQVEALGSEKWSMVSERHRWTPAL